MNTRQNTKEYNKGKYFLFIVLNKSSNLLLFSVRRPQYFNSHTTSLLMVACNAIPARSKVTFRLTEGKNVNYITPRNVSLGHLCFFQSLIGLSRLRSCFLVFFAVCRWFLVGFGMFIVLFFFLFLTNRLEFSYSLSNVYRRPALPIHLGMC